MNGYQKFYELKNDAKNSLEGKYGNAIGVLVTGTLITNLVTSWITGIVGGVSASALHVALQTTGSQAAYIFAEILVQAVILVASILLGVLNAGIALFYLNASCGQPCSVNNLFYGFGKDNKKCLCLSAVLAISQTICLLPYQYLFAKVPLAASDAELTSALLFAGIALLVGGIVYLPVSMGFGLVFFFMLDFPTLSAKETLTLCWNKMKGQKFRLFRLNLSFLPLMLLCILSFGIGFLWLRPYMQMTYAKFYLNLMNPEVSES